MCILIPHDHYPILLEDNLKVFTLVCGVAPVAFYLKDGYVNSKDVSLVQITSTAMIFVPFMMCWLVMPHINPECWTTKYIYQRKQCY